MLVNLKDINVYYRQWGSGSRAILCFHGWGMNGDSWAPLAKRFSPREWRVIMPDLRGFGRSDKPPSGYHINDYMRDAVRLIRSLNLTQVDVLGHSFGGTGALYLAARIPHLVRRLVVFDTIPGAANPAIHPRIRKQFERIQTLAQRTKDRSLPTLLTRIWRQSLTLVPPEDQVAAQAEASQAAERHAVLATLNTVLTTDIARWLNRLKVPTLVIRGEKDPLLQDSPDGLEYLPQSTRVIIPDTGHYPPIERPDLVWAHVSNFLTTPD